jgi:hypothetical protein
MSALPPIAAEFVRQRNMSRWAISCREQMQQQACASCAHSNTSSARPEKGSGTAIPSAPESCVPERWNSNPCPTLVSEPQQERPMTSQDPSDPPPTSTDPARRFGWGIGALVAVVLIMAAIAYAMNRSPTSSTATGPSATQSAPSTIGQGGAANTGAAR